MGSNNRQAEIRGANKPGVGKILRQYSMIIILVLIAILFHFLTNGLIFTPINLTNLILQNSYIVLLILGMLPVILTGNVDLSVGSVLAFIGALAAVLMQSGIGVIPAVILCLLAGIAIGCWQGFWISRFDIPPFIVTLSGELVFRGLTQIILDGKSIPINDAGFRTMAGGYIPEPIGAMGGFRTTTLILAAVACVIYVVSQVRARQQKAAHGVPVKSVWLTVASSVVISAVVLYLSVQMATANGYPIVLFIMLALCLLYNFICNRTIFGRSLYAVGGNRKAAALSGIKDRRTMFLAYANMGMMAAVAGLVYAARSAVATPKAGVGYELDAIAACYVGGASVHGGAGSIAGALVGCFVIAILNNGMSMMGASPDLQQTIKGLVILAAVAIDLVPKMKKK